CRPHAGDAGYQREYPDRGQQ
ncbi:hypothetical protein AZZ66_004406, partial [Escherichia coli]